MEKDNFGEQLCRIVRHSDHTNKTLGRERVWANIKPQKKSNKGWFYSIAGILIVGISLILILDQESRPVSTKPSLASLHTKTKLPLRPGQNKNMSKALAPINSLGNEIVKELTVQSDPSLEHHSKIGLDTTKGIDKTIIAENNTAGYQSMPDHILALNAKTIENQIPTPEPSEFTVQFKRGAILETKMEEAIVLKKFRLRKDSSYLANAIERQSMKIRLTFKKNN
ncbi:hypothetical protein EZ428_13870 [Pedobacter frigiditerrae]|uniref:Uncharacterized protein n=1 Tax=Pedobacter frigiditerrae TaxID=2530452 RepID=A0A4R0MTG1_9SPHI|nr:hypothetical protein [Pedobacter frigiditerrae]TCC90359.1 hypothetical protein EZ428_13870 [Pedobacter frigiditerrae]